MATLPKPLVPVLNVGSFLVADLVMALPLAEGAGGAAADLSGNGHNATMPGTEGVDFQWVVDGQMGVVLELLTASSWIDLAASLVTAFSGQGAATLQCWLKLAADAPPAGERGLANLDSLSGAGTRTIYPDDPGGLNEIQSGVFRGTTRVNNIALQPIDRSQWHLLTITSQNGGQYLIYQNGVLLTGAAAEALISLTAPLQFGRSDDTGTDRLVGRIGDVRLWKRALEGFEVASVFNNPWGLYTFFNPPGQVDLLTVSQEYQPRGFAGAAWSLLQADFPKGAARGAGEFDLLADFNTDPGFGGGGGAYDPPVAIRTDLSPFRKPALGGTPAPTLNTDPINTGIQLALLYNDPAGAADPHTEYANALQASGITWQVLAAVAGQPGSANHRYVLSDQANGVYANGDGGAIPDNAALKPTTDMTIAAYVTFPGLPSANGIIAGKRALGGASMAYALRVNSDTDRLQFDLTDAIDGLTSVVSAANPTIAAGGSYIIVGTYNGAIMRLYVNGVESANAVNGGAIDHSTDPFGINQNGLGSVGAGGNSHVEAVFLWDRALTPDEVRSLSNNPFGMFCDSGYVPLLTMSQEYQPRGFASLAYMDLLIDVPKGANKGCGEFDLLADMVPGATNSAGLTFFSITPVIGSDQGGTPVTIKGRNFADITQVLIGGTALGSMVVVDSGTITGVTPAHLPGSVSVRVDSSTRGFVEGQNAYTFVGGFGPAVDQLIQGKQIATSFWQQETFVGETAPQFAQTTLALTLADIPIHPDAVEVYVRRLDPGHAGTDDGGLLMRQGGVFTYTVDTANRKIIWESTAQFGLLPLDEITVVYLARGEIP